MKLDIEKLKGLAEAALYERKLVQHNEFTKAARPAAVLELVAEIKRMRSSLLDFNLERDQLKGDNEALRNLLLDASEQISTWGSYASEYFQEKHDLAGCVAKFHEAAMNQEQP